MSRATDAPCRHCGGPVPISLAGPAPECTHCRATDPLVPALADRIARLRARLSSMAARQQRLVRRQYDAAQIYAGGDVLLGAALTLCLYALLPGLLVGTLPANVEAVDFYLRGRGVESGELLSRWWFFWSFVTSLAALVAAQRLYAAFRAWTLVTAVVPRPPDAPGAPPGCRVCGGPLQGQGRVVPCGYCGATHLITGRHHDDHATSVEERLASLEKELKARTALGQVTSQGLWLATMTWAFAGPSLAVAYGHYGVGGPVPDAWRLTLGLSVLAVLTTALARHFAFPRVPTENNIECGERVALRGIEHVVAARMSWSGKQGGVLLLFAGGENGLFARHGASSHGDREYLPIQLATGGEPLKKQRRGPPAVGPQVATVHGTDGAMLAPGRAWVQTGPNEGQLRLWAQAPEVGTPPRFTLTMGAKLHPREVLLLG